MITFTKTYTAPEGAAKSYPKYPRVHSDGTIWVHGSSGLYIYRPDGSTLRLVASDTRAPALRSVEDAAGYIHVSFSSTNQAYTWDGTTLSNVSATVEIKAADSTYIYRTNGSQIVRSTYDGSTVTDVGTYALTDVTSINNLMCFGDTHIFATTGSTSLDEDKMIFMVYNFSNQDSYTSSIYWPEDMCTNGTYIYTDNTRDGYNSIYFFIPNPSSPWILNGPGSGGEHYNTRGICYNADDTTLITSGLLDSKVKEYAVVDLETLLGISTSADSNYSAFGICYLNGYIYNTTNGTSVWGASSKVFSGSRCQAYFMDS